jgi:hypothetical protein
MKSSGIDSPNYCESPENIPGYFCLENRCPHMTFSSHENALCYVGEKSVVEEIISFGGEMIEETDDEIQLLDKWKEISMSKLNEAYEEFMKYKRSFEAK